MSTATAADPAAVYRFVEVADGGVDRRGRVKLLEQVDGYGKTDQYVTYARGSIELLKWVQTHKNENERPTTRGFTGEIWADRLHMDIDAKDLEKALQWTRIIYQRLIDWGVPVDAPRIYYSGSKGFHLEVPAACFGGFPPGTELHRSLKAAATLILQDITFDSSVYNKLRLWRIENTLNSKGRYKIRLTPGELLVRNLGELQALALAPRAYPEPDVDIDDWLPVPELVDIWSQAQDEASKPASSGPAAALGDDERDRITIATIGASWPRTDEQGARPVRHDYLLAIGGFLARRTNKEHVAALLKAGAASSGDGERDWDDEIDRIAASSAEKAAAGTHLVGLPRLAEQFPGLAKALGALWWEDSPDLDIGGGLEIGPDGQVVEMPRRTSGEGNFPRFHVSTPTSSPENALPDVPDFPTHVFPGPARRLVEESTAALDTPPDLIAVPLLALVGGVIGRRYQIMLKPGWCETAQLYTSVVAPPGSAKTPALGLARAPVERLQREAWREYRESMRTYKRELEEYEAAKKNERGEKPVEPRLASFYTTDATLEAVAAMLNGGTVDDEGEADGSDTPGLTLIRDELVAWVASCDAYRSGRGADRQTWLSLWAGAALKVDRKTGAPVYVEDPVVSVTGGVQPDLLRDLADEAGRRDGFVERILWSYPDVGPARWTDAEVSVTAVVDLADDLAQLRARRTSVLDDPDRPAMVRLSPEARAAWVAWYGDNNDQLERSTGIRAGMYAKLRSHVARFALILHCLAHPNGAAGTAVTGETMAAAVELGEYFRAHAERVLPSFGARAIGRAGTVVERITRALAAAAEGLGREALRRKLGAHVSSEQLSAALAELEEAGVASRETVQTSGRPAEIWKLLSARKRGNVESPPESSNNGTNHVSTFPRGDFFSKTNGSEAEPARPCQRCTGPIPSNRPASDYCSAECALPQGGGPA